jgi:hypothetical protein
MTTNSRKKFLYIFGDSMLADKILEKKHFCCLCKKDNFQSFNMTIHETFFCHFYTYHKKIFVFCETLRANVQMYMQNFLLIF